MKLLRLAGRLGLAGFVAGLCALVALQFTSIVARNLALSRELGATRTEIQSLRDKKIRQLRHVARLSDPRGSIPEIHDRLRLVGAREELIYLKGGPTPAPAPWDGDP